MNFLRLLTLTLILAPLSACSEEETATHSIQTARPVLTVVVTPYMRGRMTTYVGEISPNLETSIAFKANGRIAERLVKVGDIVTQGQVLLRLERSDFQNQLLVARADVVAAEAAHLTARASFERHAKLVGTNTVSRAAFDAVRQEAESAKARLESAEANLNVAREALDQAEVVAPTAGVITVASGNPFQVVTAGQEVARIAALERPEAVFDVPEQLIRNANQNIDVHVSLLSDPSVVATGQVIEVSPVADPSTRTYRVRVALNEAPEEMMLGTVVSGSLILDSRKVYQIPATSLTSHDGAAAVYVVDPAGNTVARKLIEISHQNESSLFVLQGLNDGDRVVTAGVTTLIPGQVVSVLETVQ